MAIEYSLGGHVVAPPSGPVEGVRVKMTPNGSEADEHVKEDRTDGDGEFSVTFDREELGGPGIGDPVVLLQLLEGDQVAYEQEVTLSGRKTSVTLMAPSLEGFEPEPVEEESETEPADEDEDEETADGAEGTETGDGEVDESENADGSAEETGGTDDTDETDETGSEETADPDEDEESGEIDEDETADEPEEDEVADEPDETETADESEDDEVADEPDESETADEPDAGDDESESTDEVATGETDGETPDAEGDDEPVEADEPGEAGTGEADQAEAGHEAHGETADGPESEGAAEADAHEETDVPDAGPVDTGPSMPYHGTTDQRGMANVPRDPSRPGQGRFGRLFPNLPAADHDVEFLEALGLPGDHLDEGDESPGTVESVPAGVVFLSQFVDHDVTFDPLSSHARQADPDALRDYRTPGLDLDSVYGAGPEVDRSLYQSPFGDGPGTGDGEKFLLGVNDAGENDDLPRTRDGTAIVADARNDANPVLSQFHHVMLKFHNRIVDWLRDGRGEDGSDEVFADAQRLARWHYQWIVLNEYLPTVCDEAVVEDVRDEGRQYYTVGHGEDRYLPVEFAGAAVRFGHSQARRTYRVNDVFGEGALFGRPGADTDHLGRGFQPVPAERVVDWRNLFDVDSDPQPARRIDTKLPTDLLDRPSVPADSPAAERSLASRTLVRGRRLGLPSGQAVARRMGLEPLGNDEIGFEEVLRAHSQPLDTEAPLWYYVLGEAGHENGGAHLGPVGSRIVAEVVVGLVENDPRSYTTVQPNWEPTLPAPHSGDGEFTTADLVAFALDY